MYRYLIRPKGYLTTPKRLHQLLGTQRIIRYGQQKRHQQPDWEKDFFLSYLSPPNETLNSTQQYTQLHNFYCSNKRDQRQTIEDSGIRTPSSYPTHKFIVRPLHHYGGRDYRVTQDHHDFNPQSEYISNFFPKNSEYRIIFVKGQPLITLLKHAPEGVSNELPWNHRNGGSFITVNNEKNNRLRHTSCLADLLKFPIIQNAHLCAVDILYRRRQYAVLEINFCPSITIQDNLERIREHVYPPN